MANRRVGNTAELERLEAEVARLMDVQKKILEQKRALEEKVSTITAAHAKLEQSLSEAYEKIKAYEGVEKPGEVMKKGFVEITTMPYADMLPPPSMIDGIQVPRKRDPFGNIIEVLPVDNALRMMSEGSGYKRFLTGPAEVYEIQGEVFKGMHKHPVTFKKHRIVAGNKPGTCQAVEVALVDPTKEDII